MNEDCKKCNPQYSSPIGYQIDLPEIDAHRKYHIRKQLEIAMNALSKIANEDYRGNRSPSSIDANNALIEIRNVKID